MAPCDQGIGKGNPEKLWRFSVSVLLFQSSEKVPPEAALIRITRGGQRNQADLFGLNKDNFHYTLLLMINLPVNPLINI